MIIDKNPSAVVGTPAEVRVALQEQRERLRLVVAQVHTNKTSKEEAPGQ